MNQHVASPLDCPPVSGGKNFKTASLLIIPP
jgi:hypothetical protein